MIDGSLNEQPGEVWPRGTVTILDSNAPVHRLLSLVLPAVSKLRRRHRWTVWVAPPCPPSAQLLADAGLSVSRTLMVYRREGVSEIDMIEQALSSRTNDVVLAWPASIGADTRSRLRHAAERGGTRGLLLLAAPTGARATERVSLPGPVSARPSEQLSLDVSL